MSPTYSKKSADKEPPELQERRADAPVLQSAVQELGLLGEFLPVLRVLSFVLLLGNLEFVDLEEGGTASARVAESARGVLRDAASLVQCAEGPLEEALTVKKEDKLFGRVPLNSSQVVPSPTP